MELLSVTAAVDGVFGAGVVEGALGAGVFAVLEAWANTDAGLTDAAKRRAAADSADAGQFTRSIRNRFIGQVLEIRLGGTAMLGTDTTEHPSRYVGKG